MEENKLIAIVRVRGRRNLKPQTRKTLELLKLHRTNHAVVYRFSPSLRGMLLRVKDYVTFGEISPETLEKLIAKRGYKGSKRIPKEEAAALAKAFVEKNERGFDPVFRLHPPRKGWKSIKKPFTVGGDLGQRDNMDELLARMM